MRNLILAFSIALALITPSHAAWFGPDEETIKLQHQLAQQQEATGDWMITAGILAILVIIAFIIGTILGTKALRALRKGTNPNE